MEQLNKHQLILLALLVSFVTSIATGIVTVSLMEQAPPQVTETINRVVEKTIERVVTEPSAQTAAAVVAKETIVVKADDAVIEAIEKNIGSIVRIREVTGSADGTRQSFVAIGLIVSSEGHIASDISVAYRKNDVNGNPIPETYVGVFPDGRVFPLNIVYADQSAGVMFFQPLLQDREKGVYKFFPPVFGPAKLKLGQAVIAIGGDDSSAVSTGIISNLSERSVPKTEDDSPAEKVLSAIRTDIRTTELVPGSVLLNLSGEVIGMNAGALATTKNTFLPIDKILAVLSQAVVAFDSVSTEPILP